MTPEPTMTGSTATRPLLVASTTGDLPCCGCTLTEPHSRQVVVDLRHSEVYVCPVDGHLCCKAHRYPCGLCEGCHWEAHGGDR